MKRLTRTNLSVENEVLCNHTPNECNNSCLFNITTCSWRRNADRQLWNYENTGLTPDEIEQLQKENAELKETIKNLNNNQTLKIDKFAILLNEMDIKSYEISILQEGLKILSKYNDEITYREIIILLRYGSILFPNSCYDNDLKEEAEQVLKGGTDDE